jgi:hypothetical protein
MKVTAMRRRGIGAQRNVGMGTLGRLAITIGIRILEVIFVFGIVGSILVVILAGYEDVRATFGKEKEKED